MVNRYYSKSTGGFYSDEMHGARQIEIPDPAWVRPTIEVDGQAVPDETAVQPTVAVPNPDCKIPVDAVPVSDEDYHALLAAQSGGKVIQADENGHPIAAEPEVSHNDGIKSQIIALESTVTARRLREAIIGTDGGWLQNLNSQIASLRAQLQQ